MAALVIGSGVHGRGAFAAAAIRAGDFIIEFTGPLLSRAQTTAETLALQVAQDVYIGASGGVDDCVNHSCEPNAGMRVEGARAMLFALRDIAAGEEVLFDYSTTLDEDDFTMRCSCGTPSCRGTIGDGKYLPEDTWRRYVAAGIVPAYVRESRARLRRPARA